MSPETKPAVTAAAAPLPAREASPPIPPRRTPEPRVSVDAEPVASSRIGRVVSHIPLLRRVRRPPEAVTPPVPVHQVQPQLSARQRGEIIYPVGVNVRVHVDQAGKVFDVDLLSDQKRYRDLEYAAIWAARHWDFAPARVGDERVPGEVILHFHFVPAE